MINITFSGRLDLSAGAITLRGLQPILNGEAMTGIQPEILQQDEQSLSMRFGSLTPGDTSFTLEAHRDERGRLWLRYGLEALDPYAQLLSFGLRFEGVENLRHYLRNGYNSWDGSAYVDPEGMADFSPQETRPETGYAMTQLLPRSGGGCVVLGFDRNDRFQHTFTFDTHRCPPSLTILTLWDDKPHKGATQIQSEQLVILEDQQVESGLRAWADILAQASPLPPRLDTPSITGWSSWYNLYTNINKDLLLDQLLKTYAVATRDHLPMRVFQVDDGFTPEMGDWLEVKSKFPRGMKSLLDEIRAAGFVPGLWIAPFLVGNRSRLFRNHPDWVVKDRETGRPLVQMALYGENRWHKRSEQYFILDTTNPKAFEYLRQVFRTWRWEWGCEYFKTDFMVFGSEHGPDQAIYYKPGLTRIEIWRQVAEMIREEIGPDATWLGCGCPLWASIGLVDGVRIGGDVGVSWSGELSAQSLLQDLATRNFANNILWQVDPDSVLLRTGYHYLDDVEVRSLAIYAGMSGGVMMTGDDLAELSPERLRLWKLILNPNRSGCSYPGLGRSPITYELQPCGPNGHTFSHVSRLLDPVIVQVRAPQPGKLGAVYIFNTGDSPVQRTYDLCTLGLPTPLHAFDWVANQPVEGSLDCISLRLERHEGRLLFVGYEQIGTAPERLP